MKTKTHVLRFDTGQIGPLREVLKRLLPLTASIEDFVKFRVIVDANCVVQTLLYRVRYPERGATALEELITATVVDVHAPRWLETEMISAIRQAAVRSRLPESALWACWTEFRTLLKWDDSLREPGPAAAGCCDPKDVPYVLLERRLGADGILSKDPHIKQLGGHPLTLDFVLSARSYARAAVTTVSIRVLGVVVPATAMMVTIDLLRRTGRAAAALPNPVKALLLLTAALALFHPGSRKWIKDQCVEMSAAIAPAWDTVMELVTTLAATSAETQAQAMLHLREATKVTRPKRRATTAPFRARRRRTRARLAARHCRAEHEGSGA